MDPAPDQLVQLVAVVFGPRVRLLLRPVCGVWLKASIPSCLRSSDPWTSTGQTLRGFLRLAVAIPAAYVARH